jgi:hypothetical protein
MDGQMANLSNLTRAEQVLHRLRQAGGSWVDGPDLANEEVGGSEGLKRLRELREAGHDIRKRQHPDPDRDIYQYRLVPPQEAMYTVDPSVEIEEHQRVEIAIEPTTVAIPPPAYEPAEKYDYRRTKSKTNDYRLGKTADGKYAVVYDGPDEPLPVPDEQVDMGVPIAPQLKFTKMPTHLELGSQVICPRCKGRRKHNKATDRYAEKTHDPYHPTQDCMRCDGFGVIPA